MTANNPSFTAVEFERFNELADEAIAAGRDDRLWGEFDGNFPELNTQEFGRECAEIGQFYSVKEVCSKVIQEISGYYVGLLVAEYTKWNEEQGLSLGSADDHHHDDALTDEQRKWLRDFSVRWDAATTVATSRGIRFGGIR